MGPRAARPDVTGHRSPQEVSVKRQLEPDFGPALVRATAAAALAASRWVGRGEKEAADQAAVDAIRNALSTVRMRGVVIATEGEKDNAPMFKPGEALGNGTDPEVDIAVDPIDGTNFTAKGLPNAIAVMALAERHAMRDYPTTFYMNKIAVGPEGAGVIDIEAPPTENLRRVARRMGRRIDELTVVMLDRPRHDCLIEEIRHAGARIKLINGGDVAAAVETAMPYGRGVDILMGIGGAPEALLAACALKALGGEIECKPWPRNDEERRLIAESGSDELTRVYTANDLVTTNDLFFAATGITQGEFLRGVTHDEYRSKTHSFLIEGRSGTVQSIETWHPAPAHRDA
jgi:fructose-1,6-bisphosphatase II